MIRERIKLSKRLQAIADCIDMKAHISDIGSDHAFIPIYLLVNKITDRILITDIKKGPIEVARKNMKRFAFDGRVQYRIGNGLDVLNDNELDNVVVAGMGGELIQNILEKDIGKARKIKKLILQPMNLHNVLRKWLWDNEFCIENEILVNDKKKLYNILCTKYIGAKYKYNDFEIYIGTENKGNDNLYRNDYIKRNINEFEKQIKGYLQSKKDRKVEIEKLESIICDFKSQIISDRR